MAFHLLEWGAILFLNDSLKVYVQKNDKFGTIKRL